MNKKIKSLILVVLAIFVVTFVSFNCFTIIEPGHTGVVVTLGKVDNNVLQEGMHKVQF